MSELLRAMLRKDCLCWHQRWFSYSGKMVIAGELFKQWRVTNKEKFDILLSVWCMWCNSDSLLKKLIVMQDHLPNWKWKWPSGLQSPYLLFLIIWVFPVWECCTFKKTPPTMPSSKTRNILKHGKKSPFPYIQLKFWAQL